MKQKVFKNQLPKPRVSIFFCERKLMQFPGFTFVLLLFFILFLIKYVLVDKTCKENHLLANISYYIIYKYQKNSRGEKL